MKAEIAPNDRRYVDCAIETMASFLRSVDSDPTISAAIYFECIAEGAAMCKRIEEGEPSPWHDAVPEDYVAIIRALPSS